MIFYSEDLENSSDVQKLELSDGIFLFFVPSGNKFEFCSNNPRLDAWCKTVRNKKVKENHIRYVVAAACKNLPKGSKVKINLSKLYQASKPTKQQQASKPTKQQQASKPKKIDANEVHDVEFAEKLEKDDAVDTRLKVAERLVEYPYDYKRAIDSTFKTKYMIEQVRSNGGQAVKCTLLLENGMKAFGFGGDKKEAWQNAAKELVKSRLKINVDKFEQFNMVDEIKAWNALESLSVKELDPIFDNYEANEKLPDIVVDFLEQKIAEAKERAEQERLYQQQEVEREQKEAEQKNKLKQTKFALIDKQSDIVSVEKVEVENGRGYVMSASDGTKYHVQITYGQETKKKGVYKYRENYWDGKKPDKYVETPVSVMRVSCETVKNGKKESFTLKTTSPHLQAENPYRLDLMFLANLNMAVKNTSVGHLEEDALQEHQQKLQNMGNAYLVLKLLSAANDQIVQSPKLLKQWRSNKNRVSSLSNDGR